MAEQSPREQREQRPKSKRFQRVRPAWWVAAILAVAGIGYFLHQPHQTTTLLDGTRIDLISATRNISMNITAGESRKEQQLLVRYWSDKSGIDQMRNEARGLATKFYPIADANHLDILVLKPSRPGLTRTFPVLTYSADIRFSKDRAGFWREDPVR
jgi:hypothetical protein